MNSKPVGAPPAVTPPLSAFDFAKGTPKWWTVVCIQGQTPSSAKWMCEFAEAYAAALAFPSAPAGLWQRALKAIEHAASVCPQELTALGATMKAIRARAENALANRE